LSDPGTCFLLASLGFYLWSGRASAPQWLQHERPYLSFIVLSALAGALGLVHGLKWVIGRARPYEVWQSDWPFTPWHSFGPHFVTEGIYSGSFPSGHTASVVTLLMLAYVLHSYPSLHRRRWAWLWGAVAVAMAMAMAVGRVMTASHWLTDCLGMILPTWMVLHWMFHRFLRTAEQREYVRMHGGYPSVPAYWELRLAGWGFLILLGLMGLVIGLRSVWLESRFELLVLAPLGIALLGFAWPRFRKLHETVLSVFFVVQANDPA
jgi:membrane-associated PAP2 superfamily phosphatase